MKRFLLLLLLTVLFQDTTAQCSVDIGEDEFQPICYTPFGMYATQLAPWAIEEPGWTYSWSPTTGLDNPNILQPMANPMTTTTYTLTASGPGCPSFIAGTSRVEVMPNTPAVTPVGPINHSYTLGNQLILSSNAPYGGWYKNGVLIQGCCNDTLIITFTGSSNYTDYYKYYCPYSCNWWSNTVQVNYIGCGICRVTIVSDKIDSKEQQNEKIKAMNELENIQLFPNPASSRLKISSKSPITEVEITNLAGAIVERTKPEGSTPYNISVEGLPVGYYICTMKMASGMKQLPFVIQR